MDLRVSADIRKQIESDRQRNRRFNVIMGCGFGVFFAALIGLGVYAFKVGQEAHRRFMSQCMEDHKEYECTALWRAGDSSSGGPTVIFIPSGR